MIGSIWSKRNPGMQISAEATAEQYAEWIERHFGEGQTAKQMADLPIIPMPKGATIRIRIEGEKPDQYEGQREILWIAQVEGTGEYILMDEQTLEEEEWEEEEEEGE